MYFTEFYTKAVIAKSDGYSVKLRGPMETCLVIKFLPQRFEVTSYLLLLLVHRHVFPLGVASSGHLRTGRNKPRNVYMVLPDLLMVWANNRYCHKNYVVNCIILNLSIQTFSELKESENFQTFIFLLFQENFSSKCYKQTEETKKIWNDIGTSQMTALKSFHKN